MKKFMIRQYGRSDLALKYRPDLSPMGAWESLRDFIRNNRKLRRKIGLDRHAPRTFTPEQVRMITEELGTPFEEE